MKSLGYRLTLIGAIVLVLANGYVAYRSVRVLVDNEAWVSHTLEVISTAEKVALQLRSAESASRGYVLTGNDTFTRTYLTSTTELWKAVDQVQSSTGDNALQQNKIPLLRERVKTRLSTLQKAMQARQQDPSHALEIGQMFLIDPSLSIQNVLNDIEAEENRLLLQRDDEASLSRTKSYLAIAFATLLDVVLIILMFRFLAREQASRVELASRAEEISILNAELESRVAERTHELQVSNQELEAFSYSVSHDLRAPLRTIDGFSLALYEDYADKLDADGRDYIARVRSGVQRMGQLIDALLQLSRVTRADVVSETVDLSQLASLVAAELKTSDPQRTVDFEIARHVTVEADSRLLRIAFENLFGNAWKFTAKTQNPKIEFGTDMKDGVPIYFVRDNGAGFDMKYVDRLFTAFQRLHGDRDFKGSGIGLATVSRIIRRHQGTIWAEGRENEGATFFFTLGKRDKK